MITIDRKTDSVYYVNDKLVRRDMNDNWVAPFSELTQSEYEAFFNHVNQQQ